MKNLLLLCLLSSTILAQNTSIPIAVQAKEQNSTEPEQMNTPYGIIKEYYKNGKVKSAIPYKGELLHGIRKEYYETGKFTVQIPYKNGLLDGTLKEYYRTGKLRYEIPFKNNILHGMFKAYYETGKEKYETPYVNGEKHGMGKIYNPTGKARKILFKEGTFNGTITIKSETGKTIIDITIKDGNVTEIL